MKYCYQYKNDSDHLCYGPFSSKKKLIDEVRTERQEIGDEGSILIIIGKPVYPTAKRFLPGFITVLDLINDGADEEFTPDEPVFEVKEEAADALQITLERWANKYLVVNYFTMAEEGREEFEVKI